MQTILDADHHLDRVVTVRWYAERVHPKIFFLYVDEVSSEESVKKRRDPGMVTATNRSLALIPR